MKSQHTLQKPSVNGRLSDAQISYMRKIAQVAQVTKKGPPSSINRQEPKTGSNTVVIKIMEPLKIKGSTCGKQDLKPQHNFAGVKLEKSGITLLP